MSLCDYDRGGQHSFPESGVREDVRQCCRRKGSVGVAVQRFARRVGMAWMIRQEQRLLRVSRARREGHEMSPEKACA